MPRRLKDARLDTRTARLKLKRRGKPYYRKSGGAHLGYRRTSGKWVARYSIDGGPYAVETFATADDHEDADGNTILTFAQADDRLREIVKQRIAESDHGSAHNGPYTVSDAVEAYLRDHIEERRSASTAADFRYRANAHILPALGDIDVAKLTKKQLTDWHRAIALTPPRKRTPKGEAPGFHDVDMSDPDEIRRRKYSANKNLVIAKAAMSFALAEGLISADPAVWREVARFPNVEVARSAYLSISETRRLINACQPINVRLLVQAAVLTGGRYGELCRLRVRDFNGDAGTVFVSQSKSGKSRHVILSQEAARFFASLTAGRDREAHVLVRPDGEPWGKGGVQRAFKAAVARAGLEPRLTFHGLRHTWASQAVMSGVPLMVVAQCLGHADVRMVTRHYGHLSSDYLAETIRTKAPVFGIEVDSTVTTIG